MIWWEGAGTSVLNKFVFVLILSLSGYQCIGHDYMAYMDYLDLNVCCSKKVVKLNSLRPSDAYMRQ